VHDVTERVRRSIYDAFAHSGRCPGRTELPARLGVSQEEIDTALSELADARHLALDPDREVVMAHPFTSTNLGFSVMGERTLWWGGCAWDSFAVPNLVPDEPQVLVATTCPGCESPLAWNVSRSGPPDGDEVAHFLVPMQDCWVDVVHTCRHQRLFCSETCVRTWLDATGNSRGYVMDLATLWRLAHDWYTGRLDSPYERRDPEEATAYFRSVGLHGAFWGLDD
jgi:hypothetical protein